MLEFLSRDTIEVLLILGRKVKMHATTKELEMGSPKTLSKLVSLRTVLMSVVIEVSSGFKASSNCT